MASQQIFHVWVDFKTKKEISWREFVGSSALRDNGSKRLFLQAKRIKNYGKFVQYIRVTNAEGMLLENLVIFR